jgi:DNA polymerase III alpha subunit (gram-positive type)
LAARFQEYQSNILQAEAQNVGAAQQLSEVTAMMHEMQLKQQRERAGVVRNPGAVDTTSAYFLKVVQEEMDLTKDLSADQMEARFNAAQSKRILHETAYKKSSAAFRRNAHLEHIRHHLMVFKKKQATTSERLSDQKAHQRRIAAKAEEDKRALKQEEANNKASYNMINLLAGSVAPMPLSSATSSPATNPSLSFFPSSGPLVQEPDSDDYVDLDD